MVTQDVLNHIRNLYDSPEVVKVLRDAAERGVKLEFIIHKNFPQIWLELAKKGKATLYYSPVELEHLYETSDDKGTRLYSGDAVLTWDANPAATRLFRERFETDKHKQGFRIPPDKADEVYAMIKGNKPPEKILEYLVK